MQQTRRVTDVAELGLALIGGLIALVLSLSALRTVLDSPVVRWPLPNLLLVEWAALGIIGPLAAFVDVRGSEASPWAWALWGCVGGLVAVGAMAPGALSLYLMPTFLAYIVAGVLANRRRGRSTLRALAFALAVAVVNGGLLFLLARVQYGL